MKCQVGSGMDVRNKPNFGGSGREPGVIMPNKANLSGRWTPAEKSVGQAPHLHGRRRAGRPTHAEPIMRNKPNWAGGDFPVFPRFQYSIVPVRCRSRGLAGPVIDSERRAPYSTDEGTAELSPGEDILQETTGVVGWALAHADPRAVICKSGRMGAMLTPRKHALSTESDMSTRRRHGTRQTGILARTGH
jgi:hypothetical protein